MLRKTTSWIATAIGLVVAASGARATVLVVPDDHATIQAAVNAAVAGDTVQVRPGTYAEAVRIENAQTGLVVEGLGGRPLVTPPAGKSAFVITLVDAITIRGLDIQGGARGIQLDTSVGSTLTDLVITSVTKDGIRVRNGSANTVSDCVITGAHVDGIRAERSDGAVVTGNMVAGSGRRGIQVKSGDGVTVTDNSASGSVKEGVEVLRDDIGALVTGNDADASGRVGIRVKAVINGTISGNTSTGSGRNGLELKNLSGGTFDGNTVSTSGMTGIRIRRCTNLAVTNNDATGNPEYGFWVTTSPPIDDVGDLTGAGNTASGNTIGDFRVDP